MFIRSGALRSLFAFTALVAAAVVHGQNINVTAANASNDAIYTVNFTNQTITIENTDGGKLHSLRSLVFTENVVNDQLDLLAADNAGGLIVRYCGDFTAGANPLANTAGVVVWNNTQGGPSNPDGLSVDSAGNLFVANQASGTSTSPALWVLQGLGTDCTAKKQPTPTFAEIDSASYGAKETLEETLIAATTIPLPLPCGGPQQLPCSINPGDLLVLTTNPVAPGSRVLLYPGSQGLGPCTSGCASELTPFTLISLGTGVSPGGMAFWPVDNSLLVTTGTGNILQFNLTTLVQQPNFFSGLGNGEYKIKTGVQGGSPFAFLADNNGGRILEFNGPNQTPITVTNGVQHPQGLAVTNIGFLPFAQCSPGPCAPLDPSNKKLITHQVPLNASGQPPFGGNIVEDICIRVDPRSDGNGNCPNSNLGPYPNGVSVAQMCGAAFDNPAKPIYIPNYLCGASGPNKNSFALVRTLTQAYNNPNQFPLNGTAIENDSLFPGMPDCTAGSPTTPLPVLAWAPLAGEGAPLAGNDVTLPVNSFREVTNGCGGGHSNGPYLSLWGIGFNVNQQVFANLLTDFANNKYATLLSTLNNTAYFVQPPLQPKSLPDGNGNNTQLQQCVNTSQVAFGEGNSDAALELLIVDQYTVNNASNTSIFPPSGTNSADPSGLVRALVENQYFTIDERINNGSPFPISKTPPVSPLPQSAIPPTIGGTPITHVTSGTPWSFTPTAGEFFDRNNTSTLSFSVVNAPVWAGPINPTTGQLSGTAQKGTFNNIMISVTDGCASATLTFNLKVTGN